VIFARVGESLEPLPAARASALRSHRARVGLRAPTGNPSPLG
jgi:hypothetical protein